MATKQFSKAKKATKKRAKRIPSVKRLERVRPLQMSMVDCPSEHCNPLTHQTD